MKNLHYFLIALLMCTILYAISVSAEHNRFKKIIENPAERGLYEVAVSDVHQLAATANSIYKAQQSKGFAVYVLQPRVGEKIYMDLVARKWLDEPHKTYIQDRQYLKEYDIDKLLDNSKSRYCYTKQITYKEKDLTAYIFPIYRHTLLVGEAHVYFDRGEPLSDKRKEIIFKETELLSNFFD